jgi:sugar-specific transcriptional regulator TrmB
MSGLLREHRPISVVLRIPKRFCGPTPMLVRLGASERHLEQLALFGLDPEEGKAYTVLLRKGPQRASEVAHEVGLGRTGVYNLLQRLVQRGFATVSLSRPAIFSPVPLDQVLQHRIAEGESRRDALRRAFEELAEELRPSAEAGERGEGAFRIIRGRPEFHRTAGAMLQRAQDEVVAVSTHPQAVFLGAHAGLADLLGKRLAEGVRMRVVLGADAVPRRPVLEPSLGAAVRLRQVAPAPPMRFLMADRREVLLGLEVDPSPSPTTERDVAAWTDAAALVRLQVAFFEALWTTAHPVPGRLQ